MPLEKRVESRFVHIDDQFAEVRSDMDTRFAKVDEQFAEVRSDMATGFAGVDQRFANVDGRLDEIIRMLGGSAGAN